MANRDEDIKAELDRLVQAGMELLPRFQTLSSDPAKLLSPYQVWYSRALRVVRDIVPERHAEFEAQYRHDGGWPTDATMYKIEHFLSGIEMGGYSSTEKALLRLGTQIGILEAATARLDDILFNIRGVLQADLFDSEIDAARHLKENGHLRAAGAVAGVVLERHLADLLKRLQRRECIHDVYVTDDGRDGECFTVRVAFRWTEKDGPLDFGDVKWWSVLELDPYEEVFGDE